MKDVNSPKHIAIIMDGNRRWARAHNLPISLGHKKGAETLENIVRYANKIGLEYITVYAFSTKNWKRNEEEVSNLILLLKKYLDDYTQRADSENIKVRILGNISKLRKDMQESIKIIEKRTVNNTGVCFNIAINYDGRDEIVRATKKIAQEINNGELNIEDINEDLVSKRLYTYDIPDPDILIRTSGELRLSGFLIWQLSYTEFLFIEKNWPDFNEQDLDMAIEEYKKRSRKFGAD